MQCESFMLLNEIISLEELLFVVVKPWTSGDLYNILFSFMNFWLKSWKLIHAHEFRLEIILTMFFQLIIYFVLRNWEFPSKTSLNE